MSEILLSQLAYAELISPKPDETVKWMVDVLGLEETTREGQSVYLRGWAEWLHSSLIVTEGPEPALGHVGLRTYGPDDPEIISKRVEGASSGWPSAAAAAPRISTSCRRPTPGRGLLGGRALRGAAREGRERLPVPPTEVPRPRRAGAVHRPRHDRHAGHPGRHRLHQDVRPSADGDDQPRAGLQGLLDDDLQRDPLDARPRVVPDFSGATGRLNHIAYRVDQRLDVERAAEVFMANDTPIEFGPGIHGIDEITYLYVREPGGCGSRSTRVAGSEHACPTGSPSTGTAQGGTTIWKNLPMPDSMMECFPGSTASRPRQAEEGFATTELFAEKG